MSVVSSLLQAAADLAAVQRAEAEAFLRAHARPGMTDGRARRMAAIETDAQVVVAETKLHIARAIFDQSMKEAP